MLEIHHSGREPPRNILDRYEQYISPCCDTCLGDLLVGGSMSLCVTKHSNQSESSEPNLFISAMTVSLFDF